MKRVVIILLVLLIVAVAGIYGYTLYIKSKVPAVILSFEDCLNAGNLVVATTPRECHTKDGQVYYEEDNHLSLVDYIVVKEPQTYSTITTPFKIEGQAHEDWFGDNKLRVKMVDWNWKVIADKIVSATGDPGKNDMRPFVAGLSFQAGGQKRGRILIEKLGPRDIPGHNGPLVIPVRFK
jgi:hypothetical protein